MPAVETSGMEKYIKYVLKGKNVLAVAAMLVGVILLALSGKGSEETVKTKSEADELSAYAEKLEQSLGDIISDIEGTDAASVMITFDSSFENVYAYNSGVKGVSNTDSRTAEKELVLVGGSRSDESPVIIKKLCPKVKGVLVVCRGGNDETVRKKITDAATALFGITSGRVEVIGAESILKGNSDR